MKTPKKKTTIAALTVALAASKIRTLKWLTLHPAVTYIESGHGIISGWNPDTKVVVHLRSGWMNRSPGHFENVVIGRTAAEVLAVFNSGGVRFSTAELFAHPGDVLNDAEIMAIDAEQPVAGMCQRPINECGGGWFKFGETTPTTVRRNAYVLRDFSSGWRIGEVR